VRQHAPIPEVVAARLLRYDGDRPLYLDLLQFGDGLVGVTEEDYPYWVIRDVEGRVVGGAKVMRMPAGHPVSLDVAIAPDRQGLGWATALYDALTARGIDVEAGSSASLAHGTMTLDGYLFMRARRLRTDPDAEAQMVAEAHVCPMCGPLDKPRAQADE
jgi:GNAT superfamily N-acetyltransferase